MVLRALQEMLESMEGYAISGDGKNCSIRCPYCGGSSSDKSSFSIKVDVDRGEPVWYQCFRASCGVKGVLTTAILRDIGITDMDVIAELANHNREINPGYEKTFNVRQSRDYRPVNLPTIYNRQKMEYFNRRLGLSLGPEELASLKVQLSLADMIELNGIRRLPVSTDFARLLNQYCIGFVSMYNDYLVCRDVTPDRKTGMRYFMYRISGKAEPDDMKIYSIPRDIDIMSPKSAVINVAEGPFSILGAYFNTDIGKERPNNIWLANCGSQYQKTIMRVCRQYGLLKVRINIWSDSEVKIDMYKKLYNILKNSLDIRSFTVLYNGRKEDFGYERHNIKIITASIV